MDDRGGRLVKALLKVLHKLHEPTPIDLRISVVSPYDGERLTFCKVDGVGRGRSGHRHTLRETRRGWTGTESIAPVRTRKDCFGTRFQRRRLSNSGIYSRSNLTSFKIRAAQGLSTDVLHLWWKSPPTPQKTPAVVGNLK